MKHPQLEAHYKMVLRPLLEGKVVPFIGAGVNLCGRPRDPNDASKFVPWQGKYIPSGWELMEYLVKTYNYPKDEPLDLLRVSQFVAVTSGTGPLYEDLHNVLAGLDFPITSVHRFLAGLPALMRVAGIKPGDPEKVYPLIITTNYDDIMERAFDAVGEPYDLVYYAAQGDDKWKFMHKPPAEPARPILKPNAYLIEADGQSCMLLDRRPVILKIHGAIDREAPDRDSYVITEDDYIDYLTLPALTSLLPVPLPARLTRCHFLFLGYSLADWNMRAFFRRIWRDNSLKWKSWAVEIRDRPIDQIFWKDRNVDVIVSSLEDYFADQAELLKSSSSAASATS
jgi:SIR2-like domain